MILPLKLAADNGTVVLLQEILPFVVGMLAGSFDACVRVTHGKKKLSVQATLFAALCRSILRYFRVADIFQADIKNI